MPKKYKQDKILMDAFRFNLRDLHANREGYLTQSQGSKIIRRDTFYTQQVIAGLIIVATISSLIIFMGWLSNHYQFGFISTIGLQGLIFSGLLLPFFVVRQTFFVAEVQNTRHIASTQGIIVLDISGQRSIVKVGRFKLRAHRNALLTLKHMEPYVIHYLPESKTIVSVEAMQS